MASQNYAEYQVTSPQLSTRTEAPVIHKYEAPPDSQYGTYQSGYQSGYQYYGQEKFNPAVATETEKPRKKYCGLTLRVLIPLIIGIIIIGIIAIVAGAVLGTRHKNNNNKENATIAQETGSISPDILPSSSTAPAASATGATTTFTTESKTQSATTTSTSAASLTILKAVYATLDITEVARKQMQKGTDIVVDMTNKGTWSEPDPWFGNKKCLSILHQAGISIRTFAACEGDDSFKLVPAQVSPFPHVQEITRQGPQDSTFAIASVVWGKSEIRDKSVYSKLYEAKENKSSVAFTNDLFGEDNMVGTGKAGVVFYTEDNFETFKVKIGAENKNVTW